MLLAPTLLIFRRFAQIELTFLAFVVSVFNASPTTFFLSEIVHDNPMWINTGMPKKLGLKTGDWVEITTFRPKRRLFSCGTRRHGKASHS
jgi:hypothetical protein